MKHFFIVLFALLPLLAFSGTESFVLRDQYKSFRCPYHYSDSFNQNDCPYSKSCKDLNNFKASFTLLANEHDLDPNLVLGYAQRLSLGGEETSRYNFLKHLTKEDLDLIREHLNEYEKKYGKIDRKTYLEENERRRLRECVFGLAIGTTIGLFGILLIIFGKSFLMILIFPFKAIFAVIVFPFVAVYALVERKAVSRKENSVEYKYNKLIKEAQNV